MVTRAQWVLSVLFERATYLLIYFIGSFPINLIFPRFKLVMIFLWQSLFTVNNSFYFYSLQKKLQFSVNWLDKFYRFGAIMLNLGNFSLHIVLTTKVLVYCEHFRWLSWRFLFTSILLVFTINWFVHVTKKQLYNSINCLLTVIASTCT